MAPRPPPTMHLWPRLLLMAPLACAHGGDAKDRAKGGGRGDLIVTMTRVSVAPKPESGERWDRAAEKDDAGGCGLIGALSGYFAPGTGLIAAGVCELVSRSSDGGDLKPEDPDLFVGMSAGGRTYRSPVIPNRHSHDRPFALYVPSAQLRGDLRVAVYDLDGVYPDDATLIADSMVSAAALRDGVELQEPRLELLRLEARDASGIEEKRHLTVSAADGLVPIEGLEIPAGVLVEVRASGSYQIGSWNDSPLGPDGYPGGGPQGYNLPGEAFAEAKHGAAVALLQLDSAAQAVVVGECVRLIAESGGRLLVGVNDRAHANNTGELAFDIRVIAPDPEVWSGASAPKCRS